MASRFARAIFFLFPHAGAAQDEEERRTSYIYKFKYKSSQLT
jgi:hypothetical protein